MIWLTPRERLTLLALSTAALIGVGVNVYRAAHERVTMTILRASPPTPTADPHAHADDSR